MFALQIQLDNGGQVGRMATIADLLSKEKPAIYPPDVANAMISTMDSLRFFVDHQWDGIELEIWRDLVQEMQKCIDTINQNLSSDELK